MKIEKLTENKIRIVLNIDDLAEKNIDIQTLIKNSDMSQKLFKKILIQAKKEVGFNVDNCKLLIEAFVSSDGFFVLTFTKIANEQSPNNRPSIKPRIKRKNFDIVSDTSIYEFDTFEDFEDFCTYLSNSKNGNLKGFAKKISLYEYNSKFFLTFSGINIDNPIEPFVRTSISEFAKFVSNSSSFESRLVEYGSTVFKTKSDIKKYLVI